MLVRAIDGINVRIVESPVREWLGSHILHVNSVRRDITFDFSLKPTDHMQREPWTGKQFDDIVEGKVRISKPKTKRGARAA